MLSDTQKLINNILEDNNMKKTQILKPFMGERNFKKKIEEPRNLRLFNSEKKIIKKVMNTELSEDGKDEDKKIISKRINVIHNNDLGDETNRINKNSENSEGKIIPGPKSEAFEEIKTKQSINMIKINFEGIKQKEKFNCFHYLCYMIFCKKIISQIQYYENIRRLIISEEIMFQNYLNIYKLLELTQDK